MSQSQDIPTLLYCPKCSLFFCGTPSHSKEASIGAILLAARRLSGPDILFTDRIIGILQCLNPDISKSNLVILQRLSNHEKAKISLQYDDALSHNDITAFAQDTASREQDAYAVFNAIRLALGKKPIYAPANWTEQSNKTKANPPVIAYIKTSPLSPLMESEEVTIEWFASNAESISLVHRYNDYESLSVDVTSCNGQYTFNAFRSELIELVATGNGRKAKCQLTLDVVPTPKFNMAQLPDFSKLPNLDNLHIPNFLSDKEAEDLSETLRGFATLKDNTLPYMDASRLAASFFKELRVSLKRFFL